MPSAFEFLQWWFGDSPNWITLWRGDNKLTTWVTIDNQKAIDLFASDATKKRFDAYFGVCQQLRQGGQNSRGQNEAAAVVPGLWVDLDYADKPHAGEQPRKKIYPTREAVDQALAMMPFPPSVRVVTGGGIHAYWKFDRPFLITSTADNGRAAELVKSWQGQIKSKLLKIGGFGADSTHDLARVLRLPGTIHTKHPGLVVSVDTDEKPQKWPLCSMRDIEAYVYGGGLPLQSGGNLGPLAGTSGKQPAKASTSKANTPAPTGGQASKAPAAAPSGEPAKGRLEFSVNESSEPPSVKLFNLLEASTEFKNLWTGKKKYASPSEYDMALANFAINSEWTPNEAAALLVAFHRQHSPDHVKKVLRITGGVFDYLQLTISKAFDKRRIEEKHGKASQSIQTLAQEVREAERDNREVDRASVLTHISDAIGLKVIGFRQTGRRDEVYSLLIANGSHSREVVIGGASAIHSSPARMCERIMADCGKYVPISKDLKKEWGSIVAGLIAIREFHEVHESDLCERVREAIEEYLHRHRGAHNGEVDDVRAAKIRGGKPFVWKSQLYLIASEVKRIAIERDKSLGGGDLYVGLKQLGFTQTSLSVGKDGAKTSRSYWHGVFEFDAETPNDFEP